MSDAGRDEHDYVIVGAGSAGCVLAARLSEDPAVRVLLLEAGGEDRKFEIRVPAAFSKLYRSEVDWGYSTAPQAALDGRHSTSRAARCSAAHRRSTHRSPYAATAPTTT